MVRKTHGTINLGIWYINLCSIRLYVIVNCFHDMLRKGNENAVCLLEVHRYVLRHASDL